MITGRQIRAARALLGWDAATLAERAGLTRETVSNIENSLTQGRGNSLDKILQAFASNGVEFTDHQGVRMKPTGIEVYDGVERFNDFSNFLYEHLRLLGGEVCVNMYDETLVAKYRKDPELHRKRMRELVSRGDVIFKVLTTKSNFITYDYVQFKYQPQQRPTPTGFYAFGDCLALMSFVDVKAPYIVVIQSGPLVEGYRQSFYVAWDNAADPPKHGADL